jgi:hypothetical protein
MTESFPGNVRYAIDRPAIDRFTRVSGPAHHDEGIIVAPAPRLVFPRKIN